MDLKRYYEIKAIYTFCPCINDSVVINDCEDCIKYNAHVENCKNDNRNNSDETN